VTETRPVAAAVWMLASMLILGVIDNFIVVMAEVISLWQMYVIRLLISIPVVFGVARLLGQQFLPVNWWPVLLRSFLFASAMLFYFASLAFLPIAQSLAGLFTSPIIVVLITALFFARTDWSLSYWRCDCGLCRNTCRASGQPEQL